MKNRCLIAIALCLCACHKNPATEQVLVRADSLMQIQPDSTLMLLERITLKEVRGAEQRAYHALLLSQAYDKNYIDIISDSLIRIAYDYYRHSNDISKQALACYYLGQVQVNAGDHENATTSFLDAVQYGEEAGDHYLLGLSHTQLGQLYENQNLFPQAIEHYKDAFSAYSAADMPQHKMHSLINIGSSLDLAESHTEALDYYQQANTLARHLNDTLFLIEIGRNIGSILYGQGDFDKAQTHLLGVYEKYNTTKLEYENYQHETHIRHILITAISIIVVLLLTGIYLYKKAIRIRDARIRQYLRDLEKMSESRATLLGSFNENKEKERRLKELLENRFNTLKSYANTIFEYESYPEKMGQKIKELMRIDSLDNKTFSDIRELINERYDGALDRLIAQHPNLQDDDIDVLCLIRAGFSTSEMCAIYNTFKVKTIYQKKYRLKIKMGLPEKMELEEYLSRF